MSKNWTRTPCYIRNSISLEKPMQIKNVFNIFGYLHIMVFKGCVCIYGSILLNISQITSIVLNSLFLKCMINNIKGELFLFRLPLAHFVRTNIIRVIRELLNFSTFFTWLSVAKGLHHHEWNLVCGYGEEIASSSWTIAKNAFILAYLNEKQLLLTQTDSLICHSMPLFRYQIFLPGKQDSSNTGLKGKSTQSSWTMTFCLRGLREKTHSFFMVFS